MRVKANGRPHTLHGIALALGSLLAGVAPNSSAAQEPRLAIGIGAGTAEADGLLAIPFVRENGGIFSSPEGRPERETLQSLRFGVRVAGGFHGEIGYVELGTFSGETVSGRRPTAGIAEWSLSAHYRHRLSSRLSALWRLGVTRVDFDHDVLRLNSFGGPPGLSSLSTEPIPNETGWTYGTGLRWDIRSRWGIELAYHGHELDRTDLASVSVAFVFYPL